VLGLNGPDKSSLAIPDIKEKVRGMVMELVWFDFLTAKATG